MFSVEVEDDEHCDLDGKVDGVEPSQCVYLEFTIARRVKILFVNATAETTLKCRLL